ncbi:MAG: hypothetical protein AABY44_02155 [Nitrospirota bacterium]
MKTKIFAVVLLLVCFFAFIATESFSAEKVRVIEGLIENINNNLIEVRDRYYDIKGVPLINASGQKLTKDYLKIGKKVEIYFKDGSITSILIHEYMVE